MIPASGNEWISLGPAEQTREIHWNMHENIGNQPNIEAVFQTGCRRIFPVISGGKEKEVDRN